jgi:hypothetical protein
MKTAPTPAREAVLEALDDELMEEADGMEEAGDGDPMEPAPARPPGHAEAEARWAERFERKFPAGPGHLPQAVLRRLAAVRLSPDEKNAFASAKSRLAEIETALAECAAGAAKARLIEAQNLLATGTLDTAALSSLAPKSEIEARDRMKRRALKSARGATENAASLALADVPKRVVARLEKVIEAEVEADRVRAAKYGLNPTESSIVSALRKAMERPAELAALGAAPMVDIEAWIDPAELAA